VASRKIPNDCGGPPAWRPIASFMWGGRSYPNITHDGFSITAGYKAVNATKLLQTWHTSNVKPIRLPAAMEPTATRPTDTTSNLTTYTLRDRDHCKPSNAILRFLSDFIGWRLENFRHLLSSAPRAHHLPEWRGGRLHVRQRCRTTPLPRSR
jgi:hypothetical protein